MDAMNSDAPIFCPRTLLLWSAAKGYKSDVRKINIKGHELERCGSPEKAINHWLFTYVPPVVKSNGYFQSFVQSAASLKQGWDRWYQKGGDLKVFLPTLEHCTAAFTPKVREVWERVLRGCDAHFEDLQILYRKHYSVEENNQTTTIQGLRDALQKMFEAGDSLDAVAKQVRAPTIAYGTRKWSQRKVMVLTLILSEMEKNREDPSLLVCLAKTVETLLRPHWAEAYKDTDINPLALAWLMSARSLCPQPKSENPDFAKLECTRLGFTQLSGVKSVYLRYPEPYTSLHPDDGKQGEDRQHEIGSSVKLMAAMLPQKKCPDLWPLIPKVQCSLRQLIHHYKNTNAEGALTTVYKRVETLAMPEAKELPQAKEEAPWARPEWKALDGKLLPALYRKFDELWTEGLERISLSLYDLQLSSKECDIDRDVANAALSRLVDFMQKRTAEIVKQGRENLQSLN